MKERPPSPIRRYDAIVIGGGPGGYVAAIRAAQLGMKTALVERAHLGGVCLNWGCIPTKALLRSADAFRLMQAASEYGLKIREAAFDLAGIVARSRAIASQLNQGVEFLLKKNRVDVVWGAARFLGGGEIRIDAPPASDMASRPPKDALGEGVYAAPHIIIATGGRPRLLPGLEPDGERVWTYVDALRPKALPASLVIFGAGAIGVEFACFYSAFGVKTTLIETKPRILPLEDADVSDFMRKKLEQNGVVVFCSVLEMKIEKSARGAAASFVLADGGKKRIESEKALSAVGVLANYEELGLEDLGVRLEKGAIAADGFGRTNVEGIYAIGDVAGPPMLAHKAEHEGVVCVEAIHAAASGASCEAPHALDKTQIPSCIYASPQIASVGLTEEQAAAAGFSFKVGRFPFSANGKALALGETDGFVKTIFDQDSGRLLGAHLIGPEVSELIHSFVLGMKCEATEAEFMRAVFPHPTLSEALQESVLDAYGQALHK